MEYHIDTLSTGYGMGWDGWGWGACVTTRVYEQPVGFDRLPDDHLFPTRKDAVVCCLTIWANEGGEVATRANIALARLEMGADLTVALKSAGIFHQER